MADSSAVDEFITAVGDHYYSFGPFRFANKVVTLLSYLTKTTNLNGFVVNHCRWRSAIVE